MLLSSSQLLELIVILCNAHGFFYAISRTRSALAHAQSKSGPVRPDSVPTRFNSAPFCAVQISVFALIPVVYTFTVVGAGLQRPPWMYAIAFPEVIFGIRVEGFWKNTLRVLACVVNISLRRISDAVYEHLGDQYHPIGRREKPRVVQTGPYAWVRHPLYALGVLNQVLLSLMFWSYVPLFAIVPTVVVFGVKIRVEEEAIQRDDVVREEYRKYMRKVPSKLIPHVW
ncbi:hypothetical protein HD554DRAFT_1079234 [Boletus coccyginus]|nr:hypothetical protein HD554DRAFT_1079234 [Boletus coccyginus]